jgi:hypothetical protein
MDKPERERDKNNLNKEVFIFVFFLFLSSLFWYLNELGKDVDTTIQYPVRYINPPKGRVLTGNLPDRISMELQGPGYSILKMKLSGSRAPVVVDFSKITPKRVPGKQSSYYLVFSSLTESFSRQLHADFTISAIKPDTIFYGFDRLVTKRMPVIPDIRVEVPKTLKAIIVTEPDSITVTGPKHLLDSIPGIKTKKRIFPSVSETFKASVQLIEPDHVHLDQSRVDIEVTLVRASPGKIVETINSKNGDVTRKSEMKVK